MECIPIAHQIFQSPWATAKRTPWLNSNQPSQFFICPSVFHGDTTHPSNHLHHLSLNPTSTSQPSLTSISHSASDTTGIHSTFHLQFWMSEMAKTLGTHTSISDSICSSKIRSTISIKSVSQITNAFLHSPSILCIKKG